MKDLCPFWPQAGRRLAASLLSLCLAVQSAPVSSPPSFHHEPGPNASAAAGCQALGYPLGLFLNAFEPYEPRGKIDLCRRLKGLATLARPTALEALALVASGALALLSQSPHFLIGAASGRFLGLRPLPVERSPFFAVQAYQKWDAAFEAAEEAGGGREDALDEARSAYAAWLARSQQWKAAEREALQVQGLIPKMAALGTLLEFLAVAAQSHPPSRPLGRAARQVLTFAQALARSAVEKPSPTAAELFDSACALALLARHAQGSNRFRFEAENLFQQSLAAARRIENRALYADALDFAADQALQAGWTAQADALRASNAALRAQEARAHPTVDVLVLIEAEAVEARRRSRPVLRPEPPFFASVLAKALRLKERGDPGSGEALYLVAREQARAHGVTQARATARQIENPAWQAAARAEILREEAALQQPVGQPRDQLPPNGMALLKSYKARQRLSEAYAPGPALSTHDSAVFRSFEQGFISDEQWEQYLHWTLHQPLPHRHGHLPIEFLGSLHPAGYPGLPPLEERPTLAFGPLGPGWTTRTFGRLPCHVRDRDRADLPALEGTDGRIVHIGFSSRGKSALYQDLATGTVFTLPLKDVPAILSTLMHWKVEPAHLQAIMHAVRPALLRLDERIQAKEPFVSVAGRRVRVGPAAINPEEARALATADPASAPLHMGLADFLRIHLPQALAQGLVISGTEYPPYALDSLNLLPGDVYQLPAAASDAPRAGSQLDLFSHVGRRSG